MYTCKGPQTTDSSHMAVCKLSKAQPSHHHNCLARTCCLHLFFAPAPCAALLQFHDIQLSLPSLTLYKQQCAACILHMHNQ